MKITPQTRFLHAFAQAADPGAKHQVTRRLHGVNVMIGSGSGTPFCMGERAVYMTGIRADAPGEGAGHKAMETITGLADRFGVTIMLHAVGQAGGPSPGKLTAFFAAHGFEKTGPCNEMTRRPAAAPDAASPTPDGP